MTAGKYGWLLFLILGAAYLATSALCLSPENPVGNYFIGEMNTDAGIPDMEFGYSAETLQRILDAYGERGREIYRRNLWSLDLIMPLLSCSAIFFFLFWVRRSLGRDVQNSGKRPQLLLLILLPPILAFVADIAENGLLFFLAGKYPELSAFASGAAAALTRIKWISLYASYLSLPAGGLSLLRSVLIRKFRKRKNEA